VRQLLLESIVPLSERNVHFLSSLNHVLKHAAGLTGSLRSEQLDIAPLLYILESFVVLALLAKKHLRFLADVFEHRLHPLDLPLLVGHVDPHLVPAVLEGSELVAGLLLLVIGAGQQFALDEVELDLLILKLPLLLHRTVPLKTVQSRAFYALY
jgi:hypothetical protein